MQTTSSLSHGRCQHCGRLPKMLRSKGHGEGWSVQSGCLCETGSCTECSSDSVCSDTTAPPPWISSQTIPGPPPKCLLWSKDDELIDASISGDCDRLLGCIARGAMLSVVRDFQGNTALHCAVGSGSVEAVSLLLASGAYINSVNWKDENPLQFACRRPGENNFFEKQPNRRTEMIGFLVQHGADASQLAPEDLDKIPTNLLLEQQRIPVAATVNSESSKDQVDLVWRAKTATWLIRYNRAASMRKFRPYPEYANVKNTQEVEQIFKDCQTQHERLWASIQETTNEL